MNKNFTEEEYVEKCDVLYNKIVEAIKDHDSFIVFHVLSRVLLILSDFSKMTLMEFVNEIMAHITVFYSQEDITKAAKIASTMASHLKKVPEHDDRILN